MKILLRAVFITLFAINTPTSLFALGEYDGVWVGQETISAAGEQESLITGTIIYQESDNTLTVFDELFGNVALHKSGNQWILLTSIETTYLGLRVVFDQISITFHTTSYLTGIIKGTIYIYGQPYDVSATLAHYKQSCQSISNGVTVSNLTGVVNSLRCYEIVLPLGATNLNVNTWGGSGDCDLYVAYYRAEPAYSSENYYNDEQIIIPIPDTGKWYIGLFGYESYSGVSLRASYDVIEIPEADFTSDRTSGIAPLAVQFTDTSTGDITHWYWEFGDGTGSTVQSPVHTYINPGTYNVRLTVEGPGGSDTMTKIGYIRVASAGADINSDGDVDLADAIIVLQLLAGIEPGVAILPGADTNGDTKIGVEEAIYILQIISDLR